MAVLAYLAVAYQAKWFPFEAPAPRHTVFLLDNSEAIGPQRFHSAQEELKRNLPNEVPGAHVALSLLGRSCNEIDGIPPAVAFSETNRDAIRRKVAETKLVGQRAMIYGIRDALGDIDTAADPSGYNNIVIIVGGQDECMAEDFVRNLTEVLDGQPVRVILRVVLYKGTYDDANAFRKVIKEIKTYYAGNPTPVRLTFHPVDSEDQLGDTLRSIQSSEATPPAPTPFIHATTVPQFKDTPQPVVTPVITPDYYISIDRRRILEWSVTPTGDTELISSLAVLNVEPQRVSFASQVPKLAAATVEDGRAHIYIFDRATGFSSEEVALTTEFRSTGCLELSPNGSKVIYCAEEDSQDERPLSRIFVADLIGSELTELTSQPVLFVGVAWSRDSQRIALAYRGQPGNALYLVDADGTNRAKAMDLDGAWYDNFSWAPDSSRIAFEYQLDVLPARIRILGTNAPYTISTIDGEHADTQPSWSPDGSGLAFSTNRDGNWNIYIMDANGSNQSQVTDSGLMEIEPRWERDGSHIRFRASEDTEIWTNGRASLTTFPFPIIYFDDPSEEPSSTDGLEPPNKAIP